MNDRTVEFDTLAESYRSSLTTAVPTVRINPRAAIAIQAAALAVHVKRAASLVTRLHHLARRRALFDDPAAEINELVPRIKTELQSANSGLSDFFAACLSQTGVDPRGAGPGALTGSPRTHWTLVGEVLREKAVAVTSVLQDALSTRARNLQEHNSRRRQFARSNFVPNLQADSPLWAPMQQHIAEAPAEVGQTTDASGTEGLRSRRPLGSSLTASAIPVSPAQRIGGVGGRPVVGGGRMLPGARGPPVAPSLAAPLTAPYINSPSKSRAGGAYNYTAQQVTQYHSASSRLEEQHAVESTIVEIGTYDTARGGGQRWVVVVASLRRIRIIAILARPQCFRLHHHYHPLLFCCCHEGHMMTRMATIVGEQSDIVDRIDADMDET